MTTTWTDANGAVHEIKTMPTPYIENCLSLIDDRLHTLITRLNRDGKRVAEAQVELKTKQEQKAEMLRVLHARRRASQYINNPPRHEVFTCHSCKFSDKVMLEYGRPAELICSKIGITCKTLKFSCGNWENNNA